MSGGTMALHSTGGVLIASSSLVFRKQIRHSLPPPEGRIQEAMGGAEALDKLETGNWQVLFLDRRLPDLDAEELMSLIGQRFPKIEVVLLDSDSGRTAPAVAAAGDERGKAASSDSPLPGMIGQAASMQKLYRMARLVARRETSVLITGATGSGKELVARAIHQLSPRAARAFVVVNCAALPESLLESELFGHARGAFTGAVQARSGRIEAARGGTIFLDEIGEVPLAVQSKLLRFLECRELQRLGCAESVPVDVRVVAATNTELGALAREGKFREDLLYRLSVFPLELPSLRQHLEDIVPLAEHFLQAICGNTPIPRMDTEFVRALKSHSWPGNVRELQHVVERAAILADGDECLRAEHIYFPSSGWALGARTS